MRAFGSAQERIICLLLDQTVAECLEYHRTSPEEAADKLHDTLTHMLKMEVSRSNE